MHSGMRVGRLGKVAKLICKIHSNILNCACVNCTICLALAVSPGACAISAWCRDPKVFTAVCNTSLRTWRQPSQPFLPSSGPPCGPQAVGFYPCSLMPAAPPPTAHQSPGGPIKIKWIWKNFCHLAILLPGHSSIHFICLWSCGNK